MANIKSAIKAARKAKGQTEVNQARMSSIRTAVRKVEEAIASGDKEKARSAFRMAEPEVMRGVRKGMLHRNMAARKLSRLSARIKAMAA
ncbi:MAG: 30S ribosomal protein S20 [Rhodospirillales bacterium]|nr:30S ribosomal protein S20 [Rhodospirillales bacterium]